MCLLRCSAALLVFLGAPALASVPGSPSAPPVGEDEARAFGEILTASVARHRAFDVLSAADLRRVVQLEAEKETLGCTDQVSCLAEVAGAMGARFVIFGQVSTLGSQIVLALNLFDSESASSSGRVVIRAATLEEVAARIDGAVDELVSHALPKEGSPRVRLLVLDLEAPKGTTPRPAVTNVIVEGEPFPTGLVLLLAGSGAGLMGALTLGAGGFFGFQAGASHEQAKQARVQLDAVARVEARDRDALLANALYGAGALLFATGLATAAGALLVGGDTRGEP